MLHLVFVVAPADGVPVGVGELLNVKGMEAVAIADEARMSDLVVTESGLTSGGPENHCAALSERISLENGARR